MSNFSSFGRTVKGVILDITGVLKESGHDGGYPIPGSINAINRLYKSGLIVRFCTNETTMTRLTLVKQLQNMGFEISEKDVFPPIPAMCSILKNKNLRPHLLVHPDSLADFEGIDQSNPNCVIIGDATSQFSYENLNTAFRCLMNLDQPLLFALGQGKYYQEEGDLVLDVGSFTKCIEYATGLKAEVVGKPSEPFFQAVLQSMGISANEAVMVGDDIVNDVGGAQSCGMLGVLVRTGKFRPRDENHPDVRPDVIVDNLSNFVDKLLEN